MMAKPLRTMLVAGVFGAGALAGAAALTPAGAEGDSSATGTPAATSEAQPARHGNRPALTDEQKQCMTDAGFARPETRPETPPTDEQRQAVRDAAAACGIELPAHGPHGPAGARPGADAGTDTDASETSTTLAA